MITHNLKDALGYGNRLIMMKEGRIVYEVADEAKKKLEMKDLIARYTSEDIETLGASQLD
jgi:putative ABC transport system ATP-binding protein